MANLDFLFNLPRSFRATLLCLSGRFYKKDKSEWIASSGSHLAEWSWIKWYNNTMILATLVKPKIGVYNEI